MNVQQLFDFLNHHLQSCPFPGTPVRIRIEDREFDIREIFASDHYFLLEPNPEAVEASSPHCFKCGQPIAQISYLKIKLPALIHPARSEGISDIYICERHESILDHLNDLYDEGFAGEACDLCGERVQDDNRTFVYLDRELDPWRVLCAADAREVIAKILS